MAISEKARHAMYDYFSATDLGEDVTNEMLSVYPSRDVEQPVTEGVLRERLAATELTLGKELNRMGEKLRGEMAELRDELRDEMAELRGELRGEMAELRDELRGEMAELRGDMAHQTQTLIRWFVGIMVSSLALMIALAGIVLTTVAK